MNNKFLLFAISLLATSGAFAQAPADTLQDVRPFGAHALDQLVGREAGVEVISSPGAPGMRPTVHIRGFGVIPGIEPVYIVDGMRRRNLDGLAPESIGKIEVLKDASAMGLYGPDAAAGVVVVTTKRATEKGFHAGYDFTGGFQTLAHEPARITLDEWSRSFDYLQPEEYQVKGEVAPETSFLRRHYLSAQYGGEKLSAYAGFSLLDNDGPYPGRADSQRRYAASWSAEYRPLSWLSMETTGWWNRSEINQAPEGWLKDYLGSQPIYFELNEREQKKYTGWQKPEEIVLQGKLEVRPLPGLYLRGTGSYSRRTQPQYSASWNDYLQWVDAEAGYRNSVWYQWGAEAGWSGQWRGHRFNLGVTFRRMKEKQDLHLLKGGTFLTDYGLTYGDDEHLEEQFLTPAYDIYQTAGGGLDGLLASKLTGIGISSPELKWKEGVVRAGYNFKDRYRVDFFYSRLWEEKLFSSEGYRIPAVMIGWTLSEEPWLRTLLPSWWKSLSVEASWAQPVPSYLSMLQAELMYSVTAALTRATMDTRHRDMNAKASFRFGDTTLDLTGGGFVYDDGVTLHFGGIYSDGSGSQSSFYVDNPYYSLRNQGVELSAALRGKAGVFRYSVDGHLTFYRNRIAFGEGIAHDVASMGWTQLSNVSIKDGQPVGGMSYRLEGETERSGWGGCTFPTLTGGLRASLGWNRWQLTVAGHGNGGATIQHFYIYDALTRHYLETQDLGPEELYSGFYFWNQEKCILPASFFRLDQMRVDYTLPLRGRVGLNLFASLENWFLLTRYLGSDPELALAWSGLGVETATYPSTRRTLFGVKVGF